MSKAKYDPLEAAKLGTEKPPVAVVKDFVEPKAEAKAFDVSDAAPAELPPPRPRYVLLKDKTVSIRGMLCSFKAGRVFDSAGYDIENLKSQGLDLELVK